MNRYLATDGDSPEDDTQTIDPVEQPRDTLNNFRSVRPDVICGENGYRFLKEEYFSPHCGGCHSGGAGTFDPPFTSSDDAAAYNGILSISDSRILTTITQNNFCDSCNLSREGEVYKGIEEWLGNRTSCP